MRESRLQILSGHVPSLGQLRPTGMLQRAKYSRFRNDSITSLEEGRQSTPLRVKGAPPHAPSTLSRSLPTEHVGLVDHDGPTTFCALIPKMANIKLSNPASLLGLRHFSIGSKEVPRTKLAESTAISSSPVSTEIDFSGQLTDPSTGPQLDSPVKLKDEILLVGLEEPTSPKTWGKNVPPSGDGLLDVGMTYCVRYLGCIEVLQSMRSLDFSTRTHVTREAISRLCEVVPDAKGTLKKRKPPVRFLNSVLGKSNLQFSGVDIKLTISTNCLTLTKADLQQIIANHHMQSISFASGGDPDTTDYVAYVAKDPVNQRACHILECPHGLAQDVISTIGQAFELRFKQYLRSPVSLTGPCESETILLDSSTWTGEEKDGHEYYNEIPGKWPPTGGLQDVRKNVESGEQKSNCANTTTEKQYGLSGYSKCPNIYENCLDHDTPLGYAAVKSQKTTKEEFSLMSMCKSDLFDDPCYINTQVLTKTGCLPRRALCKQTGRSPSHKAEFKKTVCQGFAGKDGSHWDRPHPRPQMSREDWFHGKLTRKAAESCLVNDGDFLVRESATSLSQYVLSGLQGGQAKHLLLVDPEGKVRTKDHIFDNVGHLIRYHVDNNLPIISSGSELCLKQPVCKHNSKGSKE